MNVLDVSKQVYKEELENALRVPGTSWTRAKSIAYEALVALVPDAGHAINARRAALDAGTDATMPSEILGQEIASAIGQIAGDVKRRHFQDASKQNSTKGARVINRKNTPDPRHTLMDDIFGAPNVKRDVPTIHVAVAEKLAALAIGGYVHIAVVIGDVRSATTASILNRAGKVNGHKYSYETGDAGAFMVCSSEIHAAAIIRVTRIA